MHLRTVLFVAGVCLGILSGYISPLASELGVTALLLGSVELVIFSLQRKRDTKGIALSLYVALASLGFFIGIIRVQLAEESSALTCPSVCEFEARVISSPERKDTYQVFAVTALGMSDVIDDIQVRVPLYPEVRIGETYSMRGRVSLPAVSYPHGGKTPFDAVSYLRTKEIGSEMMFPHMTLLDADAHTMRGYLGRWKEALVQRLIAYTASPPSLLASGMLFGDSSLPKEVKDSFRIVGISHIVVLSGFNIAIVISFVLLLFRGLPLAMRIFLASSFVIAFVMMVGAEASVIRATLMAFVGLLARALGREYVAKQALAISLFLIVMYNPFSLLHDVSLHLSFLATAGIIYLGPLWSVIIERYVKYIYVQELISTTLAAYLVTLPYVAYAFGSVSLYALFANAIVVPLVPLVMLLSFTTIVVSYLSAPLALVCGSIVSILGSFIIAFARAITAIPYSSVNVPSVITMIFVLSVCALGMRVVAHNKKKNETLETVSGKNLTDVISY